MRLSFTFYLLILSLVLQACGGRIKDDAFQRLPLQQLGLSGAGLHLLVFGALWCKPCRHEIDSLNRLNEEFAGSLIVTQYLVEGETKGTAPSEADKSAFISPEGHRPDYQVNLDRGWSIFDSLHPANGRQLPMLVTMRSDGVVTSTVQRSLDYESELRPLVKGFLSGAKPQPNDGNPNREALNTIKGDQLLKLGITGETIRALEKSWKRALLAYGFSESSMPFENGFFDFTLDLSTPVSAEWSSDSGCRLTIYLNSDGTLASHSGYCG